jgi:hypothetical protein
MIFKIKINPNPQPNDDGTTRALYKMTLEIPITYKDSGNNAEYVPQTEFKYALDHDDLDLFEEALTELFDRSPELLNKTEIHVEWYNFSRANTIKVIGS